MTFANNRDNPLPSLRQEDEAVYGILSQRAAQQHFMLHRDSYTTLSAIAQYLVLYREEISLFLYSGHADANELLLESQTANALGIAQLLGQCPKLKLVVLNGCSTGGQVKKLLECGVPAVVATSAPVKDLAATQFSTTFFQALSDQFSTVKAAFDLGLAAAQSASANPLNARRGGGFDADEETAKQPVWGLFHKPGLESALDWTLPMVHIAIPITYEPNEQLIETLIEALAPFNQPIRDIMEGEKRGEDRSILEKRKAILECLPHPISEQLRKLMVPETAGSGHVFFDKPGPDRLRQIARTYNTLIELLGFIMLGQLWDALSDKTDLTVKPEQSEALRRFFQLKPDERMAYNFLPLIRSIRLILDDNKIPYFIKELETLRQTFEEQSVFFNACQFMETLKTRLQKTIEDPEATQLCMIAEAKLSAILGELGFLANYTLASVKDIDVLKYRHLKTPEFKHNLVKLVQRFVGLAEEQKILQQIMETASVLLLKDEPTSVSYLNLSPFVIDENAFEEKADSVTKLHFFDRYEKALDAYCFRHVYKPDDMLLVIQKQKQYRVLKDQFDAFAQLAFKQTMQAL